MGGRGRIKRERVAALAGFCGGGSVHVRCHSASTIIHTLLLSMVSARSCRFLSLGSRQWVCRVSSAETFFRPPGEPGERWSFHHSVMQLHHRASM